MGRPPIGTTAMTDAERQRRRRERLAQGKPAKPARAAKAATKPAAGAAPADDRAPLTWQQYIANLKPWSKDDRIAEISGALAELEITWKDIAESQKLDARLNDEIDDEHDDAGALLIEARAEIERLRAENLKLRKAGMTQPKPPTSDEELFRNRFQADAREWDRQRAIWGGRTEFVVIADIKRLLSGNGLSEQAMEVIAGLILKHIDRDQANIDRGIPRRTYRKVLADLHTDRKGETEVFIAFKKLDVKSGRTIVISDDKVKTMSDYHRKRQERSEKSKAAAAKRKTERSQPE